MGERKLSHCCLRGENFLIPPDQRLIESDMTTASPIPGQLATPSARRSSIVLLQRAEGLAIAGVTAVLYAHTGANWWLFAALWLAPDLSMLGYVAGACRGARIYNAFHTYTTPGALALLGIVLQAPVVLPIALIWANHIGVDRALGYGLKFGNGFQWTHLGPIGRSRTSSGSTGATRA